MGPLWMPLYVEKFFADTAHLTTAQCGANTSMLCAVWRSDDGTLPNAPDHLARVSKVEPKNWERTWNAIKSHFDVDGDRVTSTDLQAELGKANAKIVIRRALGSLGGQTTQIKKALAPSSTRRCAPTAPKPLNSNNGAQANAQANYNYNLKKEREPLPLPRKGEASGSEERGGNLSANSSLPSLAESQKASKEEIVKLPQLECPLDSALQNFGAAFRKRNG